MATLIFAIVAITIFGSHNMIFSQVDALRKEADLHETAQRCLDRMVFDLRSIHVTEARGGSRQFVDAADPFAFMGEFSDVEGGRFGRLSFASLAHVPLGRRTGGGVSRIAYYVHADADGALVLRRSDALFPFEPFEEGARDPVLCENIRSLAFSFRDKMGDDFETWDSSSSAFNHETPMSVHIRLEIGAPDSARMFETMVALPVYRNME
ncbi:MAG: hypothetical protein GY859_12445 [Desulfobacterales bacterium]|nr:hypothetical protein [Desulfobacterales bacterium]